MDRDRYQWLEGKLIYLPHTRPDNTFADNIINQHMHSPKEIQLEAIYEIP